LALAAGWPFALEWELRSGGRIRVDDVRAARPLFDWLVESAPDPWPVTAEGGCLVFRSGPWQIGLRPDDADFEMFQEVMLHDAYGVAELPPRLGTVIDLGAHLGLFALRVAPLAERVICVEPAAANVAVLERNVRRNALGDKVRPCRCAITAGTAPSVPLFLARQSYGHSLLGSYAARWGVPSTEEVPALGLAELFAREQVDRCGLLKCDIEGAEYDVFEATPVDLLARIDRLIVEVHLLRPQQEKPRLERLAGKLREAGLTVLLEPLRADRARAQPWVLLYADRPGCQPSPPRQD